VDGALANLAPIATGQVVGFAGDLSQADVAQRLVVDYPAVDILINNLGIFAPLAFEDVAGTEWRWFFEVNVLSGARLSRLYRPAMRARNWGRIIFISSESSVQITAEMIH
jgi:NAD(P)-dependent dehydrogenase (short-subunit alcohol dehydrogenase family)